MDWTATAFGLLVALVGTLFTGVVLLVRRELDFNRERVAELDRRLRRLEDDHHVIEPLVEAFKHKAQEHADRMHFRKGA